MAKAKPSYRMMGTACPRCGSPKGKKCVDYRGKGKAACRADGLPSAARPEGHEPTQAELFAFFEPGTPPACLTGEGPTDGVP